MTADQLEITSKLLQGFGFIFFFFVVGFGPGFILGVLLANRFFSRDKPLRMDVHKEKIRRATEHNKQWDPEHERWKRS